MASVQIDLPASTVSIPAGAATSAKQDIQTTALDLLHSDNIKTASHVQSLTLDGTTAQSFTPPANAKSVKIMADADNSVNLKVAFGTTATSLVGMVFEPGRSEDFDSVATVSVICKSAITAHGVYLVWSV